MKICIPAFQIAIALAVGNAAAVQKGAARAADSNIAAQFAALRGAYLAKRPCDGDKGKCDREDSCLEMNGVVLASETRCSGKKPVCCVKQEFTNGSCDGGRGKCDREDSCLAMNGVVLASETSCHGKNPVCCIEQEFTNGSCDGGKGKCDSKDSCLELNGVLTSDTSCHGRKPVCCTEQECSSAKEGDGRCKKETSCKDKGGEKAVSTQAIEGCGPEVVCCIPF